MVAAPGPRAMVTAASEMVILTEPSEIVVLALIWGAQMKDLPNIHKTRETERDNMMISRAAAGGPNPLS